MPRARTLAEYIERNHLTQTALARTLRISNSYLCDIMAGRRVPSLAVAARIEQVTGVPATSLARTEAA